MSKQHVRNQIEVKTKEFERSGGTVIQLKDAPKGTKQRKIKRQPPNKGPDPSLCGGCSNVGKCQSLCLPLVWVDGNVSRKENLLKDPYSYPNESSDYNEILSNLMDEKRENHIEEIRTIENFRTRAIASMIYASIPVSKVADILGCSRSIIYDTLNRTVKTAQ